ncbi:MAG: sigma-70 family RNA polymerase sigma factor [Planctomycetes bacterium]|nr:sigma-70 family RNA polymerase sigma factor [Planctomycetota bacterium]
MAEQPAEQTPQVWLAGASRGDAQSWQSLVEAYSPRVYALIVRQTGDPELAEEITQATFVSLVENLKGYDESGRFDPWLFRIAMNRLRDEMRRRKRQARTMDMSADNSQEDSEWAGVQTRVVDLTGSRAQPTPIDGLAHKEQVEKVRAAVAKLNEADREIIMLRHTAGLSFAEIAESLGQPLGTVLARGHRALGKLRKLLQDEMEANTKTEPKKA